MININAKSVLVVFKDRILGWSEECYYTVSDEWGVSSKRCRSSRSGVAARLSRSKLLVLHLVSLSRHFRCVLYQLLI